MKKRLIGSLLIIVLLTGLLFNNAYATDTVTLNGIPDKKPGDSITVSGSTSLDKVSLVVICPNTTRLYFNVVNGGDFSDTFTLPGDAETGIYTVQAGEGTVMASRTFRVSSASSGGGSSGNGQTADNGIKIIVPADGSMVTVALPPPVLDETKRKAISAVDAGTISKAFEASGADSEGIKTIGIDIPVVPGAESYTLRLPAAVLNSPGTNERIEVHTGLVSVVLPANILSNGTEASKTVELHVENVDKSLLSAENKSEIGDRPAVDISLRIDGKPVQWNSKGIVATVLIPYRASTMEMENPEFIVVWYIDEDGKRVIMPDSQYIEHKKAVSFTAAHFSKYAVAFIMKKFEDIPSGSWKEKPAVTLASYGIIDGTSDTLFSPDKGITRGEYLGWLVKTTGLTAGVNANFEDVDREYAYYNEIGIARALKITAGVGNNKYNPDTGISRQDMMVLTARALKAAGNVLPSMGSGDLEEFSDSGKVAQYALEDVRTMVKAGYIKGSGGRINPAGFTTRAEAAQVLYKIFTSK